MLSINDIFKAIKGSWLVEPLDHFKKLRVETDSRKDCSQTIFVAFAGKHFDAHHFLEDIIDQGASVICIEKYPSESTIQLAISRGCGILKVASTIKTYQKMASYRLQKQPGCKLIGITGSSGKTSVKSILTHLLEEMTPGQVLSTLENTNNHIGVPQNLLRLNGTEKFAIIEMGTSYPGEIAVLAQCAPPQIAVITSIGDSHSGNFDPVDGILREKSDIIKFMQPGATAVIPFSQLENIKRLGVLSERQYVTFGCQQEADFQVVYHGGNFTGSSFTINSANGQSRHFNSSLTGRHQAENCAASLAVLALSGFDLELFSNSFLRLVLPGMRMNSSVVKGVHFINDAYNANPQSMKAFFAWLHELSLQETFKGKKYLLVGDMLELGDKSLQFHHEVFLALPENWEVIAVGEYCRQACQNGKTFANAESAAEYLCLRLQEGDTVALKGSRGLKLEKIIEKFQS